MECDINPLLKVQIFRSTRLHSLRLPNDSDTILKPHGGPNEQQRPCPLFA